VKVEGYAGDKIIVEVNKSIYAKTTERLEKGKANIQLGVIDRADTLIFYVEGTGALFGRKKRFAPLPLQCGLGIRLVLQQQ
jgi:hypothetical protein